MKKKNQKGNGGVWVGFIFVILLVVGAILIFSGDKEEFKITKEGIEVEEMVYKCFNKLNQVIECNSGRPSYITYITKEDLSIEWLDFNCECEKDCSEFDNCEKRQNTNVWSCRQYKCGNYQVEVVN